MSRKKYENTAIFKRIEQIRLYYNIKQSQFAKKIGVSPQNYNDVVGERSRESLTWIIGICNEYTDISIEWILTGNGEMFLNYANSPNSVHEIAGEYGRSVLPDELKELNNAILALPEDKRKSIIKIMKGIVELEM